MKIVVIILVIVGILILYRFLKFKRQGKQIGRARFSRIEGLYEKLQVDQIPSQEEILSYAKNPLTRELTFNLLKEHGKNNLFPTDYLTIEKGAESRLVNWLEFPTELDGIPDEIEYLKKIVIDFDGQGNNVIYHVFKFKINEPHWAAKNGWMIGVVGPYFDDSKPYDFPWATFSRLDSKASPEEEVKWVHENISMKK